MKACYIHVPFCNSICAYCDFVRCKYQKNLVDKWLNRIETDIIELLPPSLETIYIGGGTPSALNEVQLEKLLRSILPFANKTKEYTMEANPDSLSVSKIMLLNTYKVNRISLGIQTFQEPLQNLIQRKHSLIELKQLLNSLHKHKITNVSIDLMYGLPTQTMEMWKADLAIAVSLNIQHISLYALTIEEHSQFGRDHVQEMDSQIESDMYEYAIAYLTSKGFEHYEISNFARKGFESKHNQTYWLYEDFLGIGCGASGKEKHYRYDNTRNLHTYIQNGATPTRINLSKEDEMFETVMMGLRMQKGLSLKLFYERYQEDFKIHYEAALQKNITNKCLEIDAFFVKTTYEGMLLLNTVLLDFL